MIGDKNKFIDFEKWNGGSMRFEKIDGVYYVKDLKHNLLSVS